MAVETLSLIRHLVHSLRLRRPLSPAARRMLTVRRLDAGECVELLTRLAGLLPMPLAVGPPCATLRSEHERQIGRAVAALEAGAGDRLLQALQTLAAPAGLEPAEARCAAALLARLAGHDESMPLRCSSENGGAAMARTARETRATALPSPAPRFDLSSPQR